MTDGGEELVFCALGGLGEIGMNAALYGFGPPERRKWIMVDCGLAFAGPDLPGIDLLLPDLGFVERIRKDLLGLIITHAHEDHIGAVADLWPKLRCRVFATRFAAGLLEAKHVNDMNLSQLEVETVALGGRIKLGPFEIEFIPVAHSIPESCALAIRTPLGTVVHSGDWKIDPTPTMGPPTDAARLTAIGDEGVLALVCDSTNILRDGESPSEKEVAVEPPAPHRGGARTRRGHDLRVERQPVESRGGCRGGLRTKRDHRRAGDGTHDRRSPATAATSRAFRPSSRPIAMRTLDRNRTVLLATGSQGEPRAALARMAQDDYGDVPLGAGRPRDLLVADDPGQ